nr:hypothetical protein [Aureimonas populi]
MRRIAEESGTVQKHDPLHFGVMAVKNEIFSRPPYPSRIAISVNWLAGFDVEIKVIARIPTTA